MGQANYIVQRDVAGSPLVIRDVGPWHEHPTVTNDIEGVVRRLTAEGRLPRGRRLFYIDSDGQMDEAEHDGERFVRFSSGAGGDAR